MSPSSVMNVKGDPVDPHGEVGAIFESGLSALKEWLDQRLRQHEDILWRISNTCDPDGSPASIMENRSSSSGCKNVRWEGSPPSPLRRAGTAPISADQAMIQPPTGEPADLFMPATSSTHVAEIAPDSKGSMRDAEYEALCLPGCPRVSSKQLFNSEPGTPHGLTIPAVSRSRSGIHSVNGDTMNRASTIERVKSTRSNGPGKAFGQDWQTSLMDVFDQLDLDASESIDRNEFMEAFSEMGLPELSAFDVFRKMDKSHNNAIDRVEWLNVIEEVARSSDDQDIDMIVQFIDKLKERQEKNKGRVYTMDRRKKPFLILRHDSPYRMGWDLVMMVLLVYVSLTLPYTLGFGDSEILEVIDRIFDMLFCIDVVLNFRTTYPDPIDEKIIMDGKMIACKYLKSWFCLDFFSSVPFDLITAGIMPSFTPARLLKMGKVAKVMKLLRISKLLKVFAGSELMESIEEKTSGRSLAQTSVRLGQLIGMACVLAHWLACFGAAVDSGSLDNYFEGQGFEPTRFQLYLAAVYWAWSTLSTVGYGDITPSSDAERAYAMFAMVVGGAFYGYIIGSVTSIVSDMDVNSRAFFTRMDELAGWLDAHEDIPKVLRRRVRKHFKMIFKERCALEDSAVMSELSPQLRGEMAFFIIHECVRCNPMFSGTPSGVLANLVEIVQKNHTEKEKFIVQCNDPGEAMYILIEGIARYNEGSPWRPKGCEGGGPKYLKLKAGDSFGEEIIFEEEEFYLYTIVSITTCEFHSISEDGFKEQYKNMPELHKSMYDSMIESRRSMLLHARSYGSSEYPSGESNTPSAKSNTSW